MLTHIDKNGKAKVVDISLKNNSLREAWASCYVKLNKKIINQIEKNNIEKGDVLSTAKIAGILAAKKTGDLIPLCHPLNLTFINIFFQIDKLSNKILIFSNVKINAPTGVEMEALVAVNIAALTIYDMCKGIDKKIIIGESFLIKKSGGKSGLFINKSKIKGFIDCQDKIKISNKISFYNNYFKIIGILPEFLENNDLLKVNNNYLKIKKQKDITYLIPETDILLHKGDKICLK